MMWFFAVLIVLAMGGVAAVAAGYGTPLAEEYDDRPDATVQAEGPLTSTDVRRVRFTTAWFGYRKSEVDTLLRRLALEMESAEQPEGDVDRDTPEATSGGTARNHEVK
jgi:DivIVA domain-containing protein